VGAALRAGLLRSPCERVQHSLAILLWEEDRDSPKVSPEVVRFLQRQLRTKACCRSGLLQAYCGLWRQVA
jgi:hypothetical protein